MFENSLEGFLLEDPTNLLENLKDRLGKNELGKNGLGKGDLKKSLFQLNETDNETDVCLIHGDALKVLSEFSDDFVDLVIVDPPYNVLKGVFWDEFKSVDDYLEFNILYLKELERVVKRGASVFVFWSERHFFLFDKVLKSVGLNLYKVIIWHYPNLVKGPSNKRWLNTFDFIFHLVKGEKPKTFNAKFSENENKDVWIFPKPQTNFKNDRKMHPTQKPISLYKRLVKMFSNEGDIVLDPFCGSGTIFVAAIELNRNCYGIELNENFVEISRKRVEELINKNNLYRQGNLFEADRSFLRVNFEIVRHWSLFVRESFNYSYFSYL